MDMLRRLGARKTGLCAPEDLSGPQVGRSDVRIYLVSVAVCARGRLPGGLTYRSGARIGRAACFGRVP
jgi:hypothetical protein